MSDKIEKFMFVNPIVYSKAIKVLVEYTDSLQDVLEQADKLGDENSLVLEAMREEHKLLSTVCLALMGSVIRDEETVERILNTIKDGGQMQNEDIFNEREIQFEDDFSEELDDNKDIEEAFKNTSKNKLH